MSKAFTREDAAPDPGPLLPARPGRPQPITPGGWRRLVDERARLAAGDEAARARAAGLERILATVEVVPPSPVDGGAGFGCEVDVEDEAAGEAAGGPRRRTYTLVGPDEVDAPAGRITAESPVGRALLGGRPGDVIDLPRGRTPVAVRVVALRVPRE